MTKKIKNFSHLLVTFFCSLNFLYSDAPLQQEDLTAPLLCEQGKTVGLFGKNDPRLEGIVYANWGSRPYEYFWIKSILNVQNKKLLDLGVGIPSQHKWYDYVTSSLSPAYYAGIDADARMSDEQIKTSSYELTYMNMTQLNYEKDSFDVAYCISTFEHIPYSDFMKAIQEAYRVLRPNGLLVITLDEHWDKHLPLTADNGWNTLEQSLMQNKLFNRHHSRTAFCLPNFLALIKNYFVLYEDDAVVDSTNQVIYSKKNPSIFYYKKHNADQTILVSPLCYNSCVSYAVLKKKT
jgi:ubiquinone/menaquinone biosynthesis C-methylase UbiE